MKNYKLIIATTFIGLLLPISLVAQKVEYLLPLDNNFTQISNFSEGLAHVIVDYDSVRFINTSGEFAFMQSFEAAGNFHSGRAWVRNLLDGEYKYGFINKQGELVIPYRYDEVNDFSDNRAVVYGENGWMVINRQGEKVFGGALLNREETTSAGERYAVEPSSFYSNRLAVKKNGKYGYFDINGKLVIPFQYDIALDFKGGVTLTANEIPYEKREADPKTNKLYNRMRAGETYRKWMIIDTTGKVLFTLKKNETPDWQTGFSNGLLLFRTGRFTFGFMNKYGERVVEPMEMDQKPFTYSDGVFIEQVSGRRSDNKDGYMVLRDTTGKIVSKIPFCNEVGCIYDSRHKFHEGLLAVEVVIKGNGKRWGYIDKQGNFVIPPMYELALDFHDGRAVVKTPDGRVNYIINPLKETD